MLQLTLYEDFMFSFAETEKTSNTSNQTTELVGSVAGVVVALTLVTVLLCFAHRIFTNCNIGKH